MLMFVNHKKWYHKVEKKMTIKYECNLISKNKSKPIKVNENEIFMMTFSTGINVIAKNIIRLSKCN